MKKDKSRLLAIFLVVIVIIVLVSSTIFNNNKKNNTEIKIEKNPSAFFTVNSCLYRTTSYIRKKNIDDLLKVLDKEYVKREGITKENVLNKMIELPENSTFVSKKMYYQEVNSNITKYYVYGVIRDEMLHDYTEVENSEEKEAYFIVNIDSKNKTFSVEQYNGEIFADGEKNEK